MIVPIGHQDSRTRRRPWTTIVLIAACLAAWVGNLVVVSHARPLPPQHYQREAERFWKVHPYLEPDARLAWHMLLQDRPQARRAGDEGYELTEGDWELWLFNERLGERGRPPRDAFQVVAEQKELDRLTVYGFYLEPGRIPPEEEMPNRRFGLVPAEPRPATFFTYMFMHASWAHLLGNLFLLVLAGPALEDRWGRALYAAFYLAAGLFAGAFFAVLSMDSAIPLVGASGAVAGALGAFLVLYWSTRIRFFYYFFPVRPLWGTLLLPAWVALPLWFANEATAAWLMHAGALQSNVAYAAHVGGFLFGVLFAVAVRGFRLEDRFLAKRIDRKVTVAGARSSLAQARAWIAQGRIEEALALAESLVEAQPDHLETLLVALEAGAAAFRPDVGGEELTAWIRRRHARGAAGAAADAWVRAVDVSPGFDLDPELLIQLVPSLREQGLAEQTARALRYVLSALHDTLRAGTVFRAAELARGLDAGTEREALRRALALPGLPPPKRERLEAGLRALPAADSAPCPDPLAAARWREHRDRLVSPDGTISLDDDDVDESKVLAPSRF